MEVRVQPDDLAAAGAALNRCAHAIDDAVTRFATRAGGELSQLGHDAEVAAADSVRAAVSAAQIIGADIGHLGAALRTLAEVYDELDRTMVRR